MVNDGFSGAQPTTKSLLTLGLNITPEDYENRKAGGNIKNQIDYITFKNRDSEEQYNKPRYTQEQTVEVIITQLKVN